jgi:hypothetical protein
MRRQDLKLELEITARIAVTLRGKRIEYPADPIRIVFPRD